MATPAGVQPPNYISGLWCRTYEKPAFDMIGRFRAGASPIRMALHFVGFNDDRYWSAVKVFGLPDFIHRGWDMRAQREIAPGDTVLFASGDDRQEMRRKSYDDLT